MYKSTYTIQKLLENPKDETENFEKSEIYKIKCNDSASTKCWSKSVMQRFKKHAQIRLRQIKKIRSLKHILQNNHSIVTSSLRLIKLVTNNRHLDADESLLMISF